LFGDKLIENIQLRESGVIEEIRKKGALGVNRDTGIISSSINSKNNYIKNNTFFGE